MRFSVVIPTYQRSKILAECLAALFDQDFPKSQYEIVVVDDGSQDDTRKILQRFAKKSPVAFQFFSQPNRGQGVARNRGIEEAAGDILLLLGDDIIAAPQLLREHDRMHRSHPEENAAVLGFVTWHPKLEVTPLMEFMESGRRGGHQFAYDLLENRETADYRFFYTSNISLKRSLLLRQKFDPWFSGYGWEDIELGYRLEKEENTTLYYQPDAMAYHDHAMHEEHFRNRMRAIGGSLHRFAGKYPELPLIPSERKKKIFRFLSHPVMLQCFKLINRNWYFYGLSKKYFLEGYEKKV